MNRFFARRLLCEHLEEEIADNKSAKQQEIEKIRRQKRRCSRRAQEKILVEKHAHGEKKAMRAKFLSENDHL